MVEIELRVRKEKKFVGEPLLCWEDEDKEEEGRRQSAPLTHLEM
jgi:hypothetical protein